MQREGGSPRPEARLLPPGPKPDIPLPSEEMRRPLRLWLGILAAICPHADRLLGFWGLGITKFLGKSART